MSADSSAPDLPDIFNWQRIDDRITTSGQPSEEQLGAIRALGVTHIINLGLHTHARALPDEGRSVQALGMEYIHIPVDFENPTDDDLARFCVHMRELDGQTIHVHCIANLRVSVFLFRYRRDELRVGEREARDDMERIWRPGGVWAILSGDPERQSLPHRFAGRDY